VEETLRRFEKPLLIFLLIMAAVLRLQLLTNHGLQNNDFITWRVMHSGYGDIVRERLAMNHVPLYFLALRAWTSLAGLSEGAMRMPSVIAGIASVAALWWVGRMLFGVEVGLLAALAGVWHQLWLNSSFDIRVYGPLMLFTLLAVGGFWRWHETRQFRHASVFFVAMALGLGTQLIIISVIVSLLGLWWFSLRAEEPKERRWVTPALLVSPLLLLTPLIAAWLRVQDKVGDDEWDVPSPGRIYRNLLKVAFGDYDFMGSTGKAVVRSIGIPLLIATIALAITWRLRRRWQAGELDARRRTALTLLVWVMALPPVALYLASMKSGSMIGMVRYLSVTTAVAPIAIVAAWWGLPRLWMRLTGLVLAGGLIGVQTAFYIAGPGEGIRESMEYLAQENEPGRVAVSCGSEAVLLAFDFYHVPMPMTKLDRGEEDPDAIRAVCREALGPEGRRLYLFCFHESHSPAVEVLSEETPWLQRVAHKQYGEADVYVFDRVTEAP
jgi:4-amino-4-deoxy-L-arabinose transferase-like glycosyltransferase